MSRPGGKNIVLGVALTFLGLVILMMAEDIQGLSEDWQNRHFSINPIEARSKCAAILAEAIYSSLGRDAGWYTGKFGLCLMGISFIYILFISIKWLILLSYVKSLSTNNSQNGISINNSSNMQIVASIEKQRPIESVLTRMYRILAMPFLLVILLSLFLFISSALDINYATYIVGAIVCIVLSCIGYADVILLIVPIVFGCLLIFWLLPSQKSGDERFILYIYFYFFNGFVLFVCSIASIARFYMQKHWYFVITAILNGLPLLYIIFIFQQVFG